MSRWTNARSSRSDDGSAVPDVEVITAAKPTLLTTDGMLMVASSPFGQRGELWRMHREFFGRDDPSILIAHGTTLELHPSADRAAIEAEIRSDPVRFEAEYLSRFRSTADNLLGRDAVEMCVDVGRARTRARAVQAIRHLWMLSGGMNDAMALAISHTPDGRNVVLDCLEVVTPQLGKPLIPAAVVERFARTLARYSCFTVYGDDYGKQWVIEAFNARGISLRAAAPQVCRGQDDGLGVVFGGSAADQQPQRAAARHATLIDQLCQLERNIISSGRERVTHPVRGHDDAANAACGSLVMALQHGAVLPPHLLQPRAIDNAAEDRRAGGYWSGPGWSPTWNENEQIQSEAID